MSEDDPEYSYAYIADLLADDLMSMAAFRGYWILDHNDGVLNEENEVPFVTRTFYPILLLGYLLLKRLEHLFKRVLGGESVRVTGHVFVVTSAATYRFRPLIRVANEFPKPVTLLCTTPTINRLNEETDGSWNVRSHSDLHRLVPIRKALAALVRAWQVNARVADRLRVANLHYRSISLNLVLTELIKAESLSRAQDGIKSFHTQSPSPYALSTIDEERFYLYQHGQGISMTGRLTAAEYGLTYFTWGPGWAPEKYCSKKAQQVIEFVPVGNPMFDEMIERREERPPNPEYDVLFISQSHVLGKWHPERYEEYVQEIINICDRNEYRLGIKLHRPQEDKTYYRKRGWEEYVVDYDIIKALLNSRASVTDCSSGYLESVVLGSPVVLTQFMHELQDQDLIARIPGVYQPERPDMIEPAIRDATNTSITVDELNESGAFMLVGTVDRIRNHVTCEGESTMDSRSVSSTENNERTSTDHQDEY